MKKETIMKIICPAVLLCDPEGHDGTVMEMTPYLVRFLKVQAVREQQHFPFRIKAQLEAYGYHGT